MSVRRSLSHQLKALRLAAGKSPAEVALSGIVSKSTLNAIENAERPIKVANVMSLCTLYGVDQETTDQLVKMAQNTEKGWWEDYARDLDSRFRFFIQVETDATEVLTYDQAVLYGLLQTAAYHEAIFKATAFGKVTLEEKARFRAERLKATLGRTSPLKVSAVIDQSVLVREVGGKAVTDEQIGHLVELGRKPNFELFVLPWSAGAHAAMEGPFKIVSTDVPGNPDVAYCETPMGVRYTEEAADVAVYRESFTLLRRQAVDLEEFLR